jgi:hypothetical protein
MIVTSLICVQALQEDCSLTVAEIAGSAIPISSLFRITREKAQPGAGEETWIEALAQPQCRRAAEGGRRF